MSDMHDTSIGLPREILQEKDFELAQIYRASSILDCVQSAWLTAAYPLRCSRCSLQHAVYCTISDNAADRSLRQAEFEHALLRRSRQ